MQAWIGYGAAVVCGYLAGSVPFGLLITRAAGLGDIRAIGSGNIGATNVLRTGRKDLAIATLLLDSLKAGLVALAFTHFFGREIGFVAGAMAFVGHCYPVWLGFKGGKGIATYAGLLPFTARCLAPWRAQPVHHRRPGPALSLRVLDSPGQPLTPAARYRTQVRRTQGQAGSMSPTRPLTDDERRDWIRLSRTQNVGPVTFAKLLKRFGSASASLDALPEIARRAGRGRPIIAPSVDEVDAGIAATRTFGARIVAS